MIKPDWKIFAAKFSVKKQITFEWLSYALFCIEFNKKLGFRDIKIIQELKRILY
jgi:hypothetical protein